MDDLARAGTYQLLEGFIRSLEHEAHLGPVPAPVAVAAPAPVPATVPVPVPAEDTEDESDDDDGVEGDGQAMTEERYIASIMKVTKLHSTKAQALLNSLCAPAPKTHDRPHILLDYVLQFTPIAAENIADIKIALDKVRAEFKLPYVRLAKSAEILRFKSRYNADKPICFNKYANSPMGRLYTLAGTGVVFLPPACTQRGVFDSATLDLARDMAEDQHQRAAAMGTA